MLKFLKKTQGKSPITLWAVLYLGFQGKQEIQLETVNCVVSECMYVSVSILWPAFPFEVFRQQDKNILNQKVIPESSQNLSNLCPVISLDSDDHLYAGKDNFDSKVPFTLCDLRL